MILEAILIVTPILLAVAFFTLLERKILGSAHLRPGPNKVGLYGILQPFADAIKLFSKEGQKLSKTNFSLMAMAPATGMVVYTAATLALPCQSSLAAMNISIIMLLAILSVSVFFTLSSGWSSNSKYSLMGSYRSTAQTISYEINMITLILCPIILMESFASNKVANSNPNLLAMLPIIGLWTITMLAETNRTPFDMTEGESELVSGFNTEYSSGLFSMIFIAEYTSIIIMSMLSVLIFTNNPSSSFLLISSVMMLFLWVRAVLPRMRYDYLMKMSWKNLMPLSLALFLMIPMIKIIFQKETA